MVCEGKVDPATGLAIDFAVVKRLVHEKVVEPLDHTYLNETIAVPSAENIAVWIWDRLERTELPLREIWLFETSGCFVVYRGPSAEPA